MKKEVPFPNAEGQGETCAQQATPTSQRAPPPAASVWRYQGIRSVLGNLGHSMRSVWPPLAAALSSLGVRRVWRAGRASHPWADLGWPWWGGAPGPASPFGYGDAEGVRTALGIADVILQAGHAGRRGSGGLTLRGRGVPQWLAGRNADLC